MKPTQSLLEGKPYTPSHRTDIRETFRKFRESHVIAFHGAMKPAPIKTEPSFGDRVIRMLRGE